MFIFNVYSALLLPFFVQGLVGAGVLAARQQREGTAADGWLALLLLVQSVRLAQWMLGFAGWYDAHDATTVFMFYFPFSNWLLVGPALYFYFRSLTSQEFRFRWRQHGGHFLPALVYLAWHLLLWLVDVGGGHWLLHRPLPGHFGTKGPLALWADAHNLEFWLAMVGYVSVIAYARRTLLGYRAYAQYLNDNFSNTGQIRFRWLRNVLVAVLVGAAVTLLFSLTDALLWPLSFYQLWYDYLFTGLLIYYLSIAGLLTSYRLTALHFQLPEEVPPVVAAAPPPEPAEAPVVAAAPPAAPAIPDPEVQRWQERLTRHMADARPYLAPELTLRELAEQLQTNTSWLSKVINAGFGQNFNDYVNEYRVQEAERRLRDPKFRHYTLLAVALESGFNSKSTFNRVFRKLRGRTPGEVARTPA